MAEKDQCPGEEEEKEEESSAESEPEASGDSDDGDDDRDFNIGKGTAKNHIKGLMMVEGTTLRCNWLDPALMEDYVNSFGKRTKPDVAKEPDEADLIKLEAAASTTERLQVIGCRYSHEVSRYHKAQLSPLRTAAITKTVSDSLANRLAVLRIDNFPGSGDPVFGTRHELRRSFRAPDFFGKLTEAFKGSQCGLKKLTLQGGFHSAQSIANFLRVTQPHLQSFRCRGCLFHGRNFEMLVKSLGSVAGESLQEFETDAAIGGQDPFSLIADAFPKLRMLRAPNIFGKVDYKLALKRLKMLQRKQCKLPVESHRLRGKPAVDTEKGMVYWFITSEHHDDGHRGQGLWWDECNNTMECCEEWAVGKGVTKELCLQFMAECGIELDNSIDDEECGLDDGCDDDVDSDAEPDAIIAQLEVAGPSDGTVTLKATSLDGRQIAEIALEPSKTLVRTLVDELAGKYPCSPVAMRLILPNGSCIAAIEKGNQLLASVLAG